MNKVIIAVTLYLLPTCLCAQWLDLKTPGIPRTADGKPDLTAPTPRTADGKPDLSGLWRPQRNIYWLDVSPNPSDDSAFTPAAEAVFQKRAADFARDWPGTHCLPLGPGAIFASMYRIMQSPSVVALLFNVIGDGGGLDDYRQIFLDGRALPKNPNPTWRGYSVGHWDGDTLVVETAGFNDRNWLDGWGHPHSEKLRIIERFHRVDFGHMDFQITFDDPETLIRPLTLTVPVDYQPDTGMLEFVCENERDAPHLARADQSVKLSLETLAKYAGAYDYAGGRPPNAPPLPPWLTTITVRMAGSRLYQGPFPLNATSETTFDSVSGTLEFSLDSGGTVNGLTASGGLKFVRKR